MSDDRYHVDPTNDPAAFAEWKRGIESRVSRLEGAPITGAIRVRDIGGGTDVFKVDERGMDVPQFPLPQNFVPDGTVAYVRIPSGLGVFRLGSSCLLPVTVAHTSLRALVGYAFSPGSGGRFQITSGLKSEGVPTVTYATTVSPGVQGIGATAVQCDWNHQIPVGVPAARGSYYFVNINGIVDVGGGTLDIFEPSVTLVNDDYGATDAGAWIGIEW